MLFSDLHEHQACMQYTSYIQVNTHMHKKEGRNIEERNLQLVPNVGLTKST